MPKKLNRGYIHEEPQEQDYEFLGATKLKGEILVPDGQWRHYLPPLELQYTANFDSYSCVSFSFLNILETVAKRLFGEDWNKSDRALSVMSGTVPYKGNSLRNVAETGRTKGVVNEIEYPFSPTLSQGQFFQPVPQVVKNKAKEWLKDYKILWEWVGKSGFDAKSAMEALKESPLQVAVDAGSPEMNGVIQNNLPNGYNHAVLIYGYVEGKKWLVYNSYDNCYQEFVWNYRFSQPLKLQLIKLIPENMKIDLIRNADTGKIYLTGSDGVPHHIVSEEVFIMYFGQPAWDNKDWLTGDTASMKELLDREGEPITKSNRNLIEAILDSIRKLGKGK